MFKKESKEWAKKEAISMITEGKGKKQGRAYGIDKNERKKENEINKRERKKREGHPGPFRDFTFMRGSQKNLLEFCAKQSRVRQSDQGPPCHRAETRLHSVRNLWNIGKSLLPLAGFCGAGKNTFCICVN